MDPLRLSMDALWLSKDALSFRLRPARFPRRVFFTCGAQCARQLRQPCIEDRHQGATMCAMSCTAMKGKAMILPPGVTARVYKAWRHKRQSLPSS